MSLTRHLYSLTVLLTVSVFILAGMTDAYGQCKPTISIDGGLTVVDATDEFGLQFPVWLKDGQTVAVGASVTSISAIEFNVNGTALEFSQVLNITSSSPVTVPAGKVWKLEAAIKENNSSTYKTATFNPGTFTWTVPACAYQICIEAWGGGGGGSGNTSTGSSSGSGGGGGGFGSGCFTVSPGATYTVTVGAGGAGGNANNNGSNGGNSSVGSLITAFGGNGGVYSSSGGTGGTGTGSSVPSTAQGANGTAGTTGCGVPTGAGGAGGNGGDGGASTTATSGSGTSGSNPGGGGGGAPTGACSGSRTGGKGGDGKVIISW